MSIHWWPREFLLANRPLIDRIKRRLGYRLQLREIAWPREVAIGRPFRARCIWANAGVAPCYPGGFPALTLKDDKGGIVSVLADEGFNARELKPGPVEAIPVRERAAEFLIGHVAPAVRPGEYSLWVSVGLRDGTPRLALPLAEDDGQHRYKLGRIKLSP